MADKLDADATVGDGEYLMSLPEDRNVQAVLEAAIDAVGHEPELPIDE